MLPSASTVSTGVGATNVIVPGNIAKESASRVAMARKPSRLRDPLFTALQRNTASSIGASAARSTTACSLPDNPLILVVYQRASPVSTPVPPERGGQKS